MSTNYLLNQNILQSNRDKIIQNITKKDQLNMVILLNF